ncbi:MAG TPA: DUF4097 family beta strand repeat-containing protein [Eubacteriales bacterium]|nr:DUF4097 family beta strand repeat-containing protein [Eubacteriales bacterium]
MKKFFVFILVAAFNAGAVCLSIGGAAIAKEPDKYLDMVSEKYTAKTIVEESEVTSFTLNTLAHSVKIVKSLDGKLKIDYYDGEKTYFEYRMTEGAAVLEQKENITVDNFYLFNFGNVKHDTVVYLPESVNKVIDLTVMSGDLDFDCGDFMVETFKVSMASGDMSIKGVEAASLKAKTFSGDITLSGIKAQSAAVETGSGDVTVSDSEFVDFNSAHNSGSLEMENILLSGNINCALGSGDATLNLVLVTADYRVETRVGSGDSRLFVNGLRMGGDEDIAWGTGSKTIKLRCNSGDIAITLTDTNT